MRVEASEKNRLLLKCACLQEALRQCHGVHWSKEPNLPLLPLDVDPAPARSLNPCQGRLLALQRAGPATKGTLLSCDAFPLTPAAAGRRQ